VKVYFNSRDIKFKDPFGAVELGTKVTFRVETADVDGVVLRTWQNGKGEEKYEMKGDGGFFEVTVNAPDTAGILWYYFLIYANGSCYFYGNSEDKLGGEGRLTDYEPDSFQLTVHKHINTPDWFKDGICYYIFPDRFNIGSDGEERKILSARTEDREGPGYFFEEDWSRRPYYEKKEDGSIKRWQFYGGTLKGITEKLPYIKSLGATSIYLCPIFEASSNHRYDTADYMKIDPLLGDEVSFKELVSEAEKSGISIILDGVFSHTGCDSVYFDRYGNYGGNGAWNNPDSKYRSWYRFNETGTEYECWWGDKNLPNVEELEPSHNEFICGEKGVIKRWLSLGAKGFRLDVADELPDDFIKNIRNAVKSGPCGEDNVLIGEVWEDASNKISYDVAREFVYGDELDSTMNYPVRLSIIDFLMNRINADRLCRNIMSLYENYPKEIFYSALNVLGSHDRVRPITIFGGGENVPEDMKYDFKLSEIDYQLGKRRMKAAVLMQYCMPGVPAIYYGDEAGVEGHADPYNRSTYPWGREDKELLEYYKLWGQIYQNHKVLIDGSFTVYPVGEDVLAIERENDRERIVAFVNRNWHKSVVVSCEVKNAETATDLITGNDVSNGTVGIENGGFNKNINSSIMLNIGPLETIIMDLS